MRSIFILCSKLMNSFKMIWEDIVLNDSFNGTGKLFSVEEWRKVFVFPSKSTNRFILKQDSEQWKAINLPVELKVKDYCFSKELNTLIIIDGNRILKTQNGVNWTKINFPQGVYLSHIIWSQELNLFVGSPGTGNYAATSPDGNTWTKRNLPASYQFRDLVWSNRHNKFFLYTAANGVLISVDGINWEFNLFSGAIDIHTVIYIDELDKFIGLQFLPKDQQFITSNDGISWSSVNNTIFNSVSLIELCWASRFKSICITTNINKVFVIKDLTNFYSFDIGNGSWFNCTYSDLLKSFIISNGSKNILKMGKF